MSKVDRRYLAPVSNSVTISKGGKAYVAAYVSSNVSSGDKFCYNVHKGTFPLHLSAAVSSQQWLIPPMLLVDQERLAILPDDLAILPRVLEVDLSETEVIVEGIAAVVGHS